MNTMRRFLVLGMQRSGTSVTLACLAGHPQVAVADEEIHTAFFTTESAIPPGTHPQTASRATFLEVFDHVANRRDDARAVGLKTALSSPTTTAQLVAALAAQAADLDLVLVRRRDHVAQLGSLLRALQLDTWHRSSDAPPPTASTQVSIGRRQLADYVASCHACHHHLERLRSGRRVLDLDYERDIATGDAWPRLFAFLGLDAMAPTWLRMAKNSPRPDAYIQDYAGLCAFAAQLPTTAPTTDPLPAATTARLFLLHRSQLLRQRGELQAAVDDALAALTAPADWGVQTHEWACATLRDLLFALADRERAAAVAAQLENTANADTFTAALAAQIRDHLASS